MTTAERIVIGVTSLIALIGWLRLVGVAVSHDGEMRNEHPTGSPKYQRPSNGQISEPPTITHSSSRGAKVLQVVSPDAGLGIMPPEPVPRTRSTPAPTPLQALTSSPKQR